MTETSTTATGSHEIRTVRVFTTNDDLHGNALPVVFHADRWRDIDRSVFAATLGYPEVVFIDSIAEATMRIYGHDGREMAFAGHPLVGAGWLLAGDGAVACSVLRPPAGEVATWRDPAGRQWISAPSSWGPELTLIEYGSPEEVIALDGAPPGVGFAYCWAWQDLDRTRVRARAFAPALGVAEDEATGGAAIRLTRALKRPLTVEQGEGSLLYTSPGANGHVALGGRVILVDS